MVGLNKNKMKKNKTQVLALTASILFWLLCYILTTPIN